MKRKIELLLNKNLEIYYIILMFLLTRLVFTFIGVTSRIMLESWHGAAYVWNYSNKLWLDIWGLWDSGWYLGIAHSGYSTVVSQFGETAGQANYVFFPLYPYLIKVVDSIINNNYIAGLIISNLALLFTGWYLFKLVEKKFSKELAYKTVLFLFIFPTSFILSGVFSESLFLLLLVMIFYYSQTKQWLIVGLLGFLISLTRSLGVLMILPVLYEYLHTIQFRLKLLRWNVLWLLLFPTGLLLYLYLIFQLTGDLKQYLDIQVIGWGHYASNPLKILWQGMISADIFQFVPSILTIITTLAAIFVFIKKEISYILVILLLVLFPLASGLVALNSLLRYLVVIFPLYIGFAVISEKYRWSYDILLVVCSLLAGFAMVFWANGFHLIV